MTTEHRSEKIIIIGAGLAGLAAYHQLRQYGFEVMILEARNRAGGRIHTDHSLGVPINCGAAWIHGIDNNPIAQLAKSTHTAMKAFDYQKYIKYDHNGHAISQEIEHQFDEKLDYFLHQAKALAFQSDNDMMLSEALARVMPLNDLTDIERELFQYRLRYFEGYLGENYDSISARYWNLEETWPGDNCYLTGTYQPIINHLSQNCNIQFDSIVKEVYFREHDVKIVTQDAIFYSDFVVITLPLGVLKKNDVVFHPSLPEFKQKAIHKLGMGLFDMIFIKFSTIFWPNDCQAFALSLTGDLSIAIFINLNDFLDQPILMGFCGGERARRIEKLTEQELIQLLMRDFKKKFGNKVNISEPEALITTHWSRDIFSYGSYSYVSLGASADDYNAMAHPVADRLFFAGEATCSRFFATTHGAYLSGIREANRIKKLHMSS
jgi:polyamine oxidase